MTRALLTLMAAAAVARAQDRVITAAQDMAPAENAPEASAEPAGPAPEMKRGAPGLGPYGHEGALGTVSPWLRGPLRLQVATVGGLYTGEGLLVPGAQDVYVGGRAAMSFGATEWLSIATSFQGFSVDNASTTAGNVVAVGQISLGATVAFRSGAMAGGGWLDLVTLPRLGGFGIAGPGGSAGLAGSLEIQSLRATGNVGFHLMNATAYDEAPWDSATQLGYRAFRWPRVEISALFEWETAWLTPMLEVKSHFVTGGPDEAFEPPVYLSPAVRITPTERIAIDLGGVVGFNAGPVLGSPATLPWEARAGISYELEPFKTVEVVREVVRDVPRGTIHGSVFDAATGKPLGAAIVALPSTRLTDLATHGKTGVFESPPLEPGLYPLVAQKDGYDPEQSLVTVKVGEAALVELRLKPQPLIGTFRGSVRDERGNALTATLMFPEGAAPVPPKDAAGLFQVDLSPGRYRVEARSIGYLIQGRVFDLRQRETIVYDFVLREVPKERAAVLTKSEIKINQMINFEFNKARILPDSFYVLDEVVDILLQNPQITKLQIGGHTDNIGGAEFNQRLSEGRAQSVVDYLVDKGIQAARIASTGYGLTRPMAGNDTEGGRAKNRRVEFLIAK